MSRELSRTKMLLNMLDADGKVDTEKAKAALTPPEDLCKARGDRLQKNANFGSTCSSIRDGHILVEHHEGFTYVIDTRKSLTPIQQEIYDNTEALRIRSLREAVIAECDRTGQGFFEFLGVQNA